MIVPAADAALAVAYSPAQLTSRVIRALIMSPTRRHVQFESKKKKKNGF